MDSKNREILSYRNSTDNHVKALHTIKHNEEDYKFRLKDINWCIDQIIRIDK